MNWKNLVALFGAVLLTVSVNAQANLLNAGTPDDIGKKTAEQSETTASAIVESCSAIGSDHHCN